MPLFGMPLQNSIFNTSLASIHINVFKTATTWQGMLLRSKFSFETCPQGEYQCDKGMNTLFTN
jgi:hypothetical protein